MQKNLEKRQRIANLSLLCFGVGAFTYLRYFGFYNKSILGVDAWSASLVSLCFSIVGLLFFLHWGLKERAELRLLKEELAGGRNVSLNENEIKQGAGEIFWILSMAPIFFLSFLPYFKPSIDPQLALGYYFLYGPFWGIGLYLAHEKTGTLRTFGQILVSVISILVIYKFSTQ